MTLAFILGLVVATAGTATAAKLITGKQIKDGSISSKDLSKAVQAQLAKTGLAGPAGPKGDPGPAGGPSNGPAGGALGGSYPNPTLADAAVTTAKFATLPAVVVKKPTAQAIGAGITLLTFDTEEFDTANMFNPAVSSTKLTAPVGGIYEVSATTEWSSNVTGRRLLRINRNAEPASIATDSVQATSVGNTSQTVSRLTRLAAGDSITIDGSQTSGVALDVSVQAVSMHWVGP
jgi:hypothetical protein